MEEGDDLKLSVEVALNLLKESGFRNNYVEKESFGIIMDELCYVTFNTTRGSSFIELTSHAFYTSVSLEELKQLLPKK